MLFWLFTILLGAGIAIMIFGACSSSDDLIFTIGSFFLVVGGIGFIVSVVILICNYTGIEGYVARNEVRYEQLVYEYENSIYENDNDLGKKELMDEIRDWNEDLASNKANQKDFWIGIFIPDIYDQFDFIKLND